MMSYLFQLLEKVMLGGVRFGRTGYMHVKLIPIGQCVQTQNKCHIVMKET